MAEASSDPEPGPSTSVTVANVDVPSLLSRLRCPTSSELDRKKKVISNPTNLVRVLFLLWHLSPIKEFQ